MSLGFDAIAALPFATTTLVGNVNINVSANALLKILEEPPPKTLFILTTSSYSKIIDTIKSRCQNIFFPRISNNKLSQFMKNNISDIDKEIITNISNGNIKRVNGK